MLPAADTVLAADNEVVMTRPVTLSAADCQPLAVPVPIDLGALSRHAGYQLMWHSISDHGQTSRRNSCYHNPQMQCFFSALGSLRSKLQRACDLWAVKICIRAWGLDPQQAA